MELALKINNLVLFMVLICFVLIWLRQLKSKKTKPSKVTLIVISAMMLLVEVWRIILEAKRGGMLYAIAIIMFALTVFFVIMVIKNTIKKYIQK